MPLLSLSLQVTSAFPSTRCPMPGDALQQRHEIRGVFGEEGWQGTRHPPPRAVALPVGRWEGAARPLVEQGFPGRVQELPDRREK